MTGFYDIRHQPASFDFWIWCAIARGAGIDTVVFDDEAPFKYRGESQELQLQMFLNVVIPTAAIFGLTTSLGKWREGMPTFSHVNRTGEGSLWLPTIPEDMKGPPTVTIRNSHKHPLRNQGNEWREFAKEIGATVIEDAFDEPLCLAQRMRIYAGSPMNYFIASGPGTAAMWTTNVPCLMWMPPDKIERQVSPQIGHQHPWSTDKKRFVWEEPDFASMIEKHYAAA